MDEKVNKYLTRVKVCFIILGVLSYLYVFTFGVLFYGMDVSSGAIVKNIFMAAIIVIPAIFFVVGAYIKKRNKFIWITAVLLSVIILISGLSGIRQLTSLIPSLIQLTIGGIIMNSLLKNDVRQYYFDKNKID